jgi:FYVE zinc finger/Zinc finger, C3HC4 type (RING finger)
MESPKLRNQSMTEGDLDRNFLSTPSSRGGDSNIGRDISFGSSNSLSGVIGLSTPGNKKHSFTRKSKLMEKLFGNQVEKPIPNRVAGSLGYEIRPRVLLAATVYHNTATNLWIATINTNQRGVAKNPATANKFLKAFSFPTELEARESAIANAPPKMVPFGESPICFCCKGTFAVFRRARHCRNCGVCICSACAVVWPARMIPATYNLKSESNVKICVSCNALSGSFQRALLDGDFEEAIALYGTGNINLRAPFPVANKKDEIQQPIHCAVEGGNINILRWLIEDHFCPIKIHRADTSKRLSCSGPGGSGGNGDSLIRTSKGRSVLNIAMDNHLKIGILRYLVIECGVSLYEAKDLHAALRSLEAALTALPPSDPAVRPETPGTTRWDHASFSEFSEPSSLEADDYFSYYETVNNASNKIVSNVNATDGGDCDNNSTKSRKSRASSGREDHCCIICCDHKIDCVATPCGHSIICVQCSQTLTACPVCNEKGVSFIKIFRP